MQTRTEKASVFEESFEKKKKYRNNGKNDLPDAMFHTIVVLRQLRFRTTKIGARIEKNKTLSSKLIVPIFLYQTTQIIRFTLKYFVKIKGDHYTHYYHYFVFSPVGGVLRPIARTKIFF